MIASQAAATLTSCETQTGSLIVSPLFVDLTSTLARTRTGGTGSAACSLSLWPTAPLDVPHDVSKDIANDIAFDVALNTAADIAPNITADTAETVTRNIAYDRPEIPFAADLFNADQL